MAEIFVQKKRTVWPWVLVAFILLAAAVYFLWFRSDENTGKEQVSLLTLRENNSTVANFVAFVNQDTAKMALDHTYTQQALSKLAEATNAMASEIGFRVEENLDKVKEYADKITVNPYETSHADDIRKATDILSTSLKGMQQAKYPELNEQAEQLRNASANIDPDKLTLDQKESVKGFFRQAADLLDKMN